MAETTVCVRFLVFNSIQTGNQRKAISFPEKPSEFAQFIFERAVVCVLARFLYCEHLNFVKLKNTIEISKSSNENRTGLIGSDFQANNTNLKIKD